jgi:hypothetical protein
MPELIRKHKENIGFIFSSFHCFPSEKGFSVQVSAAKS